MTILAKVKKAGLNPLTVKVITVTVLNKPASYFGTQDGAEYWLNRGAKELYRVIREEQ